MFSPRWPNDRRGARRPSPEPERDHSIALLGRLTHRDHITLTMLAAGLSRDAIARRLGVGIHTVRMHMQNLHAKLGLHSRLELVHLPDDTA